VIPGSSSFHLHYYCVTKLCALSAFCCCVVLSTNMGDNSASPRGTKRGAITIAASDKHLAPRTNKRQRLRRPRGDETSQLCPECFALDLPKAFAEADTFFDSNWGLVLGLRQRSNNPTKFTGLQVANLDRRILPPQNSACQLCRFLCSLKFWQARKLRPKLGPLVYTGKWCGTVHEILV